MNSSSAAAGGSGDADVQRQNGVAQAQNEIPIGLGGGKDAREEDYEEEGGIRIGDIYIPPPPPPVCTFDPTGPRLMITHIEIENFKSYAEKRMLGPFHKNFTSVIGPNGSGKSNVIDAMLFVFGYRAQRIRSKKISALIHNSDKFPNCNSCTVAVHFNKIIDSNDGNTFTTVESSQFIVSRTAFKDDTSYYCIDGRRLQFKEVAKKLREQGIDLDHNRFLILQGEVEHIAMMKPKGANEHDMGMLEFLEDIIGCNRLKEPIELLSKQVEDLNEIKSQKMDRVKVVEKDIEDLRKAKDEAMQYITLENEIARSKNALCQKHISTCTAALQEVLDKKAKYEEEMSTLLKEAEEIKAACESQGKEYKKCQSEYDKVVKRHERMTEEFTEMERQDIRIIEGIKHSKSKMKSLNQNLETEQKKLQDLVGAPDSLANEVKMLEKDLLKMSGKKQDKEECLAKVINALKDETNEFQQQKVAHEHKLLGLRNIVDAKNSAMCIAQSELDIYKSAEEKVAALLEKHRQDYEACVTKINDKKKSITELKTEIDKLKLDMQRDKQELETVSKKADKLNESLKDGRIKAQEAKDSLQSHRSRGRVLDYILNLEAKGIVKGIYGRLGDLGGIDGKFDVAISTACGFLDHVVVDNVDTAEKCIEHLRRDNIGRSSFIALDKMQVWKEYVNKKIKTPENVPRLFDLIKVKDDRHLPAFYFALRDTLVADDINQATRIAFGATRYRVATLQGHIIEQSGAMTGGGTQVSRNRMGRTVTACEYTQAQVEKMEQDLGVLDEEAKKLNRIRTEVSEKVETAALRLPQLTHALQMHEMESQSLSEQVSTLKRQVEEQEKQSKLVVCDEAKLATMQTVLENAVKDHKKAEKDAAKVMEQVQKLDDEIIRISGGRVEAAQKQIDDIKAEIDGAGAKITKVKVAIKTATRNIKKSEDKIKNLEVEIEELGKNVKDFEVQCQENEEKAKVHVVQVREMIGVVESKKKTVDDLRKGWSELQGKDSVISSKTLEIKHQMEDYDRRINKGREKIHKWEKDLSKLVLQETDDSTETVLPKLSEAELQEVDETEIHRAVSVAESELNKMKPNAGAIAEYKKKEAVFLQRVQELEEITEQRNVKRKAYDGLKKQRLNEFMAGFTIISYKLKETYQMITLGGDAELELVDTLDPFSEGIAFTVRPPRKSWKCISNLSGGEKTLSSLALVFALHYYKPTPLYVMDEIDAALDVRNVSIIANYIKERTRNAQFIIISLRNNMFELADRLVGIYKTYNCTNSITYDLPKANPTVQSAV